MKSPGFSMVPRTSMVMLMLTSFTQSTATDFYLSPFGDDNGSGSIAEPFQTLHHARDAARTAQKPVTIHLRQGTYYLDSTLVLRPEDSGLPAAPVTYQAYLGEKAIISGAVKLDPTWTVYQGSVIQTPVPDFNPKYPQLFVRGQKQVLARYPNYNRDVPILSGHAADALVGGQAGSEPHARLGAFMHAIMSSEWGSLHYAVTGVGGDGTLALEGGHQVGIPHDLFGGSEPFTPDTEKRFIENVFAELDAENEWYLNQATNTLYFYPSPHMLPGTDAIELVRLTQLVEFRGSQSAPVTNIRLKRLTFTHTNHVFLEPYEDNLRSDWKINRSGAVFMEGAEDCLIDRCHFDQVGGNAVFMSNYNRRNTVSNSIINYAGESGIVFVGDVNSVRSPSGWRSMLDILTDDVDKTPGPKTDNYPAECTAHNNLIHDIGRIGKQTAGVYIHVAHKITASHNTIYNTPRAGVCVGTGHYGGHVIEYNDIFNTVQETGDHGPFNSWGRDRYWSLEFRSGDDLPVKEFALLDILDTVIIRNNRIHHNGRWGVDLDDGSSHYDIYNNLMLGMGVKLREGYFRTVRNNIILNWGVNCQVWPTGSEDGIFNNIIVTGTPLRFGSGTEASSGRGYDNNVYFNHGGDINITGLAGGTLTLAQWQARGYDVNSVTTDPQFMDPGRGDYSVAVGSPALSLGFQNFPMDRFGVMGQDWTEGKIVIQKNINYPGAGPGEVQTMLGATLSDVTDEIRISAGLADNNGVHLVSVPGGSAAAASGFMTGDVIILFNNTPVENVMTFVPQFNARPQLLVQAMVMRSGTRVTVVINTPVAVDKNSAHKAFDLSQRNGQLIINTFFQGDYQVDVYDLVGRNVKTISGEGGVPKIVSMDQVGKGVFIVLLRNTLNRIHFTGKVSFI